MENLKSIIENHKLWLLGQGGKRAYLRGANLGGADLGGAYLGGANLRGADLWSAVGNKKEIKSLQLETYDICYTKDVLQIGCQRHNINDWWGFDDEIIEKMDYYALNWWKKWKPILKQIIEMSPAK